MAKKAPPPAVTKAQAERIALLEEFVTAFDGWVLCGIEQSLPAARLLVPEQQQLLRARTHTAKAYVEHVRQALGNVPARPTAIRPLILVQ